MDLKTIVLGFIAFILLVVLPTTSVGAGRVAAETVSLDFDFNGSIPLHSPIRLAQILNSTRLTKVAPKRTFASKEDSQDSRNVVCV